jgi:hypothetical protein
MNSFFHKPAPYSWHPLKLLGPPAPPLNMPVRDLPSIDTVWVSRLRDGYGLMLVVDESRGESR